MATAFPDFKDFVKNTDMNSFFDQQEDNQQMIDSENLIDNIVNNKMALINPTDEEYEVLLKNLKDRLMESQAETIYSIGLGVEKPGLSKLDLDASIATLKVMAESLNADCIELRQRLEVGGQVGEYLVRVRVELNDFMEVRVAVVGNVDAGKSTLLGVLTHRELDNGRGHARMKLFRHKHEMESGRTSSVGNDILGFDGQGNVVNQPDHGNLDWIKICEKSSKVITFIDLAGHEKYLKTTVFGMTGHAPDFGMLMIGSNAGIIGMTKEHLGLALALGVPVFVVVTKIDMCPPNILQESLQMLHKVLKSPGCRKIPVLVQNRDDVIVSATNFTSERMCPIFQVSNVTGENLDLLKMFLNLLSTRLPCEYNAPTEFQIDETFAVPGVGTVVSGTTLKGHIKLGDTLLLGPDLHGLFIPIVIKSIHRKRMPVKEVKGGQTASFSLKKMKRSQIRKGMVLLAPMLDPKACWEFEGEILILHHPTTISVKYQAMVHVGSVRQTATIISMSKELLRTGDKAIVRFRFIKSPEYVRLDSKLVFREGRTKAVGTVTKLYPYVNAIAQNVRAPRNSKKQFSTTFVANKDAKEIKLDTDLVRANDITKDMKQNPNIPQHVAMSNDIGETNKKESQPMESMAHQFISLEVTANNNLPSGNNSTNQTPSWTAAEKAAWNSANHNGAAVGGQKGNYYHYHNQRNQRGGGANQNGTIKPSMDKTGNNRNNRNELNKFSQFAE